MLSAETADLGTVEGKGVSLYFWLLASDGHKGGWRVCRHSLIVDCISRTRRRSQTKEIASNRWDLSKLKTAEGEGGSVGGCYLGWKFPRSDTAVTRHSASSLIVFPVNNAYTGKNRGRANLGCPDIVHGQ